MITEDGLGEAMHRAGEPTVEAYLRDMRDHGWVSDKSRWSTDEQRKYLPLETRLREFADVP